MPQRTHLVARLTEGAHGVVDRQQTTFWDLLLEGGAIGPHGETWRVHFGRRVESSLPSGPFTSVAFPSEHPLLSDYRAPVSDIFIRGIASDPTRLLSDLDAAFLELSGGWRSVQRYLTPAALNVIQSGHGLLFRAPSAWACHVAAILGHHGLSHSGLESHAAQRRSELILFGNGFVIARGFRVVPGPPNPGVRWTRSARH